MKDGHPAGSLMEPTTSTLTLANRWDHWLARWGVDRSGHRVAPGLYALGNPTPDSPVFVTANYTLSFDALRSELVGVDGHILVLDTKGINVWCAAGKGTFGTEELVHRIEVSQLRGLVAHRTLILPQLGAPGIAAHEVKQRSGFKVEYGPVRAADLPAYLQTHQASPEMRQVLFPLVDRLVQIRRAAGVPLVLHGGSGIPDPDFRRAVQLGISKINFFTEMSREATDRVKRMIAEDPKIIGLQDLLLGAKNTIRDVVEDRIEVFGSAGVCRAPNDLCGTCGACALGDGQSSAAPDEERIVRIVAETVTRMLRDIR